MINVSDIVADPDFATPLTVTRSKGVFALGGWSNTVTTLTLTGAANTASGDDLRQVPEGDRVAGAMTFYVTAPVYVTRSGSAAGLSDQITYGGTTFRLVKVSNRAANGFWKAIGVRMAGS